MLKLFAGRYWPGLAALIVSVLPFMKFMPPMSATAQFLSQVLCVVLMIAMCYFAVIGEVWMLVSKATPQRLERVGTTCLWLGVLAICLLMARTVMRGRGKLRS
jgi:hypothetical protein